MTVLLNIALMNALTVLPLAALAIVVSRVARRPALTHVVWVLVLLKFVTPPLFQSPVAIEVPTIEMPTHVLVTDAGGTSDDTLLPLPGASASEAPLPATTAHVIHAETLLSGSRLSGPERVQVVRRDPSRRQSESRVAGSGPQSFVASSFVTSWTEPPNLKVMLLTVWLAGVAAWTTVQLVRAVRFQRRVVRAAKSDDALQQQVQRLAVALGLRRGPHVLLVDAAVSPMLWGCGSRAKLLFPLDLAARLDAEARATLLTHELAHFARGDHWIRLLELVATGLFWWHPVVWWARQQIEEAEEECCDAWVVSQFPHAPRQYAEALLDTIDYLCESRRALPPVACGLGQAHFIRHRLTKIMRGASPKMLSQRVRYATLFVAALLLPLQPFVFGSASVANLRRPARSAPVVVETNSIPLLAGVELKEFHSKTDNTPISPILFPETPPSPDVPTAASTSPVTAMRGEKIWSTAASPDGRYVVRATTARRVVLTDLKSNNETDLSEGRITSVAFAPDGEWFATVDQEGRVTIWDSSRGERLRTMRTHTGALHSVAVSPGGQAIAVGGRDGTVLLMDGITGELLADLPHYPSAVNCIRFSGDGRQLAVAIGDWMSNGRGEVALLNAVTGKTETTLRCPTSPGALTFASNEELIVGLWDGRTQLWNLVHQQVVGTALADKRVVSAAAFSPDNPALREAIFVAEEMPLAEPALFEESSPLAILRSLFASPAE